MAKANLDVCDILQMIKTELNKPIDKLIAKYCACDDKVKKVTKAKKK